jgi:catechol 2,3-dioxygenase-like lactoylglutathione lyase family enzyme
MLAHIDAVAMLAVSDLERARDFYEGVLGLEPVGGEEGHLITYRSGGARVNVYVSEYAGTNKANALAWSVPDVDAAVGALKAKGVAFERYDMPGMRHEGDVHVAEDGGMRVAWFKDPDGNILHLVSG